ncbi:MAG TPA: Rieske 2Fe-2S domain-containing protein [Chloroflexota bacterium]
MPTTSPLASHAAPPEIERLLDGMGDELDRGLLPARVFNDPDIHALELRRIFARCWVFVGLESEIPNAGDFCLRRIGEDPFIFIRDDDGEIRALYNSCRHRGSVVCRIDRGNAAEFSCPYHGWTYKNNGQLLGVPARNDAYRQLDLSEWGLFEAAQVSTYCGLVFANLDPNAPGLPDYLGKFKWYLDIQFHLSDGGMEVLGEPHRWWVDGDWKSGAENFCGDSSHTHMTHLSLLQTGLAEAAAAGSTGRAFGLHVNECDGHAISIRWLPPDSNLFFGYPPEVTRLFRPGRLSEAQFDLARRGVVHDGTVFPNFSFIHFSGKVDFDQPPAAYLALRVWQPRGPGKMEVWNWVLAPKEASAEYKDRAYRAGMGTFSPSGNFEQDDVTVWSGISRSAGSVFTALQDVRLNYQMGMPGMSTVEPLADWAGPGVAWPSNAGESGLRTFHRRWIGQMTAR